MTRREELSDFSLLADLFKDYFCYVEWGDERGIVVTIPITEDTHPEVFEQLERIILEDDDENLCYKIVDELMEIKPDMDKAVQMVKERWPTLYENYKQEGYFTLAIGAFTGADYIIEEEREIPEEEFWQEVAKIIAKHHYFDIDDSTEYSEYDYEQDCFLLCRLKRLVGYEDPKIKYRIKSWSSMV